MQRFRATWDRGLVTSTIVLLALILLTGVTGTAAALQANLRGVALAVGLFSAGIAIGGWALAPRSFRIMEGRILVLRNGWPALEIRLDEVQSVEAIGPELLQGSMRLFGTGGLFGYYGVFRAPRLGGYRMYATRSDGLVLVRTARHSFVLTPDPAPAFIAAVAAASPRGARRRSR